jgi:hypothetical protein
MVVVVQEAVLISAFACGCGLERASLPRSYNWTRNTPKQNTKGGSPSKSRLFPYEPAILLCHTKSHEFNQRAIGIPAALQI